MEGLHRSSFDIWINSALASTPKEVKRDRVCQDGKIWGTFEVTTVQAASGGKVIAWVVSVGSNSAMASTCM